MLHRLSVATLALLVASSAFADPPPIVVAQQAGRPVVQVNPFLLPLVRQLLYDRSGGEREDAAEDLEDIGDWSCIPALQWSAVNDPKSGVRRHARKAIEKIQRRVPQPAVLAAPWPPDGVVIDRRVVPALPDRGVPVPPPPPPLGDRGAPVPPPPPQDDRGAPVPPPVPVPVPEVVPPPPAGVALPPPAAVVWQHRPAAFVAAPTVWYSKCWRPTHYAAFGSGFGRRTPCGL